MSTTDELRELLRRRYSGIEWAAFDEVHDATGAYHSRSCDFIAMSLWPSKGLELHGFEIKVSRADWLRELRDPDKADAFKQFCDRWWLVVPDRKIVQDDLPADWGLIWRRKDKLVVSRGAAQLTPKPLDRRLLAALLRRASEHARDPAERRRLQQEAQERGRQVGLAEAKVQLHHAKKLFQRVKTFEEHSGIKLGEWYPDSAKIGDAARAVLNLASDHRSGLQQLERARLAVIRAAKQLKQDLRALHDVAESCDLPVGDAEREARQARARLRKMQNAQRSTRRAGKAARRKPS